MARPRGKQIPIGEVLQRVAHGAPLQEMADEFEVSYSGMRHRTQQAYRKLGARDNAHAVQIAHTMGLLRKCVKDCGLCEKANQRKIEGP